MNTYNVIIIGAGGQGAFSDAPESGNEHKIISFGHAFSLHPNFNLIGFAEPNIMKGKEAIEYWGGCVTTIRTACKCFDADVAVVATPDDCHYESLKQLAEYPLKLVICEKPICTDLDQAREIAQLYKDRNIPLMVNYTRRFTPRYRELKRFYDMGVYGNIIEAKLLFNRGWIHSATHGIDTFNWIFGDSIVPIIQELKTTGRIWKLILNFDEYTWAETRVGNEPVNSMFDYPMWYLAENAYNFLEGNEPLWCTGDDALKALEQCYEIMREK